MPNYEYKYDYDCVSDWLWLWLGVGVGKGVGVGVGAGAGICPELEPEISIMGGSVNPVGNAYKQQVIVLPEYRGSRWFRWLSPWFLCELKLFSAALGNHVPVQHKICKNRKIFFLETYLMNGIHLGPWVKVLNNFAKKVVFVKIFEI